MDSFDLTFIQSLCIHLCMATKTISVDLEAYACLKEARLSPKESFSRVIKRAKWASPPSTAGDLLTILEGASPVDDSVVDSWERAQKEDAPPEDPWKR